MNGQKEWWDRHPEAKERRAQAQREWWAAHPAERERLRQAGRERYARRIGALREQYPWRQPLYDALVVSHPGTEPCDQCGEPGKMMLRYDNDAQTVALLGWRCYPCRKAVGRA